MLEQLPVSLGDFNAIDSHNSTENDWYLLYLTILGIGPLGLRDMAHHLMQVSEIILLMPSVIPYNVML